MNDWTVEKSGLNGVNWRVHFRGPQWKAWTVYNNCVKLYTVGEFRLVSPEGTVVQCSHVNKLFA
jgi:hypothetical protein